MKLAKKVLAVVMALGLIACMAAMAFAANAGSYSVVYEKSTDGKTLTATVYAHNYVGLTSGTINVTYSGGAKFSHADMGNSASLVNKTVDNSFVADVNNTVAGKVIYGFYFKEMLWDSDTFTAHAQEGVNLFISAANFDIASFIFKLDGSAYEINFNIASRSYDGANAEWNDTNTGAAVPAETPVANTIPGTPDPAAPACDPVPGNPAPADPTPCDPAPAKTAPAKTVKTDGGKNTGDNGVIALVAGVVTLAGVAFVVTKKRK